MTYDPKLAAEESRRIAQHETVKNRLRAEVNQEIADAAHDEAPAMRGEVEGVGRRLRHRAVREVAATEREVDRSRALSRVVQVVDYVFCLVYGLITLEIVLEATGAREGNGFKQFVDAVTTPILAPFRTLFPSVGEGQYRLMFSYIAALVIYGLFHLAARGLIRLIGRRTAEI
jgi:uncharacterized protein YggT (Ycf19 family)